MIRDLVLFVSIRPILRRPLIHLKVGRLYERIPYVPEARVQHITDGKYIRKMLTFAIRRQKDASRRNQVPRVSCLNVFHVITAHQTDAWLVHRYTTSSKNLHEFFISICIGRSLFSISLANHIKYFSIYIIYIYILYIFRPAVVPPTGYHVASRTSMSRSSFASSVTCERQSDFGLSFAMPSPGLTQKVRVKMEKRKKKNRRNLQIRMRMRKNQ